MKRSGETEREAKRSLPSLHDVPRAAPVGDDSMRSALESTTDDSCEGDLKKKSDSLTGTGAVGIELNVSPRSHKMGALLGLSPGSVRREKNLVSVQKGDALTEQAEMYVNSCLRPEKPADLTLDRVLSHDGHLKMFRLFAEKSVCEEPVVLWTRCREFKNAGPSVAGSIALNILNNCLVPGAPMELTGVPVSVVERIKIAILEHDPSPFDDALRIARTSMAALFPQYAAFLDSVFRQMPVPPINLSPRREVAVRKWLEEDSSTTESPEPRLPRLSAMTVQELVTPRTTVDEQGKGGSSRFLLSRRDSKLGSILGMTPKALQKEEMSTRQQNSSRLREEIATYKNLLPLSPSNPSGKITASDVPLDLILANASHRKTFLLFAEVCYSEGAVLFYLRVNEFRAMRDQSVQVLQSTALNIWKNFLSSKATHQVIISSAVFARARDLLLSNQVTVGLYDECQREAYMTMAFSIYPQYLVFLNNNSVSPRKPLKPSPRPELDRMLEEEGVLRQKLKMELQLNVDEEDSSESSISFSGIGRNNHKLSVPEEVESESESTTTIGTLTDSPMVSPHRPVTRVRAVSSAVGIEVGAGLRARQAPETKKLFFNGIDMSALTFSDMMKDAAQRSSFRIYCESVHKLEYLNFLDRVDSFKANGEGAIDIWTDFLSGHSPTPVVSDDHSDILDRLKAAFGGGQVTQKLFDQAEAHVLAFLETRMFPDYIRFMYQVNDKNIKTAELRRSMSSNSVVLKRSGSSAALKSPGRVEGGAAAEAPAALVDEVSPRMTSMMIPSLRECLMVESREFEQFSAFAKQCRSAELLAFWKAVAQFERVTVKDEAQMLAEGIYDTFIQTTFDTEINISAKHQREITFDIQNGLIRQDMFENAKREVQQIVAQSLFPNYVLWLSARATENAALDAAAPRVLLPRPEIQELLAWLRIGCAETARLSGTLATFMSKVQTPTEENFASHALFDSPGSSLRLIVCSAFASHQKGFRGIDFPADSVAELRLLHLEPEQFAAEVYNAKKKKLAVLEPANTTEDEILGLISVFAKLHSGDFVVSFSERPQASIV